jgi:phospholipid/cholesterol/gamma-HCH transport system substrate-binding protein
MTRSRAFQTGLIGTIFILAATLLATRFSQLPLVDGGRVFAAEFREAGGLQSGSPVVVSGATVGKVDKVTIDGRYARAAFTITDPNVRLGSESKARITTLTLLGKAGLELSSEGTGNLAQDSTIPASHSSSPYDITNALSELTTRTDEIDVEQLSRALRTTSNTFAGTPTELRAALKAVRTVSATVADNGESLQELLDHAASLTGVLRSRNERIGELLTSGDELLSDLNERQAVIADVLASVTELSHQISALVRENRTELKPALTELNSVIALLNRNRANLQKTLDGAYNYAVELGDAVASGPFFDAYVQNFTSPGTLAPYLSGAHR